MPEKKAPFAQFAAALWQEARANPARALATLLDSDKIRFIIVGVAATGAYFILGLLFVSWLNMNTLLGNSLAYLLSFVISYLGQCLWTFQAHGNHWAMLPRYALTQGLGLGLNSIIIIVCMTGGLPYVIAMLIASALVPVFVYLISKYWVFNSKKG